LRLNLAHHSTEDKHLHSQHAASIKRTVYFPLAYKDQ